MSDSPALPLWSLALVMTIAAPFCARLVAMFFDRRARDVTRARVDAVARGAAQPRVPSTPSTS